MDSKIPITTDWSGVDGGDSPPPSQQVPLFPLPEHVLLPGLPMPYRVFEHRYKALVQDLLELPEKERWIAIPRVVRPEQTARTDAPIHQIATLGRVVRCSEISGGEYLIIVVGNARVRLHEIPSTYPYRLARVARYADQVQLTHSELGDHMATLTQLVVALAPYLGGAGKAITSLMKDRDDINHLVYQLAGITVADVDQRSELLRSRDPRERIEIVQDALAAALAVASSQGKTDAERA